MEDTKLVIVLSVIVLLFAAVVGAVLYWYKQQKPHQEMPLDGDYSLGNGSGDLHPEKPLMEDSLQRLDERSDATSPTSPSRIGFGRSGGLSAGQKSGFSTPNGDKNPLMHNN